MLADLLKAQKTFSKKQPFIPKTPPKCIKYIFFNKKSYIFTTMMAENKSQQTIHDLCEKFKNAEHKTEAR